MTDEPNRTGLLAELHLAAAFLTRLPLPPPGEAPEGAFARAMRWFPVVGALIGLAGAAAFIVSGWLLPPFLAAVVAVSALVWLTGALHEDGLADLADGFGGGRDAGAKLAIMRDSRIGTYGVLVLVLAMAFRIGSLAAFETALAAAAALVASAALSRALLPGAMALMDPARTDGLGATAGKPDEATAMTAVGLGALAAIVCLGFGGGLAAIAAALLAATVVGMLANRQIGGQTGDVLGAMQQAADVAILLVAVAVA